MRRKWTAHLHPRGRDGRFIEAGSIITWLLNGVKTSGTAESLNEDGKIGVLHDGHEYSVDPHDVLSSWHPKATLRTSVPDAPDEVHGLAISLGDDDTTNHYPLDEFVAKYEGRKLSDTDMETDPRLTETGRYAIDLLGGEQRNEFLTELYNQQISGKPLSMRQSRAALNSLGKDISKHVEGQRKLDQQLGLIPPDEPKKRSLKVENLGELEDRVAKLNKRATKIGVEPMTLKVGERSMRTKYEPVYGGIDPSTGESMITGSIPVGEEEWVDVVLEGDTPKLPGDWEFIGAVEHRGGDSNIIHGDDVRLAEFRTADADCAHCGLSRARKNTVVLEDKDGNLVQVGKSCMKDFLGWNANPDAFLDWIEDVDDLFLDVGREDFVSSRPTSSSKGALIVTAAVVRTHGFNSKKSDNTPTAAIVDRILHPQAWTKYEKDGALYELVNAVELKPEDDDTADAVLTWARDLPVETDNNYLGNLHTILSEDYIDDRKDLGLIASSISAMERDQERSASYRWFKDDNEWRVKGPAGAMPGDTITVTKGDGTAADVIVDEAVTPGVYAVHKPDAIDGGVWGEKGKRAEFVGKVTDVRTFDNEYGISYLVKMITPDGQILTTFSSGAFGEEAKTGDVVHAKGTVKEYTEFNGATETKLARVAAIDWGAHFANPTEQPKKTPKPKKPKLAKNEKTLLLRLQNMYYLRDDENVVSLVPRVPTDDSLGESVLIHNLEDMGYVSIIDDGAESGNIQATLSDLGVPTS